MASLRRACHLNLSRSCESWRLRRIVVWVTLFLVFFHINNVTFLFSRGESESNKLVWKRSTAQWGSMALAFIGSFPTSRSAWAMDDFPSCLLSCRGSLAWWERAESTTSGWSESFSTITQDVEAVLSFFWITWLFTASLDSLQEPSSTNVRWAPTRWQIPYWVLLAREIWLFQFYRRRGWGSEKRRVLPKVTELQSRWIRTRLQVCHTLTWVKGLPVP